MGDKSFDYELTLEQRRALILGELIRLPELVSMIIGFTRDKEFEDARKERMTLHPMPCAPGFSQPAAWWIMKFHVSIDIRCFHPGFMMLFVPPSDDGDEYLMAEIWDRVGPNLPLADIPGMQDMCVKDKIKVMKLHAAADHPRHRRRVKTSLYHYNLGLRGSTDEDDYGGIYYETDRPELGITLTNGRPVIL